VQPPLSFSQIEQKFAEPERGRESAPRGAAVVRERTQKLAQKVEMFTLIGLELPAG